MNVNNDHAAARPASLGGVSSQLSLALSESTIQKLSVFKDVCTRIRSSLLAGRNEIISPGTLSENLIKAAAASRQKDYSACQNGASESHEENSPGGMAMDAEPSEARDRGCSFLEPAEGWTVEYGGSWCEMCGRDALCLCNSQPSPAYQLRPLAEAAYKEFFFERDHRNYFQEDPDIGPCIVSIRKEGAGPDCYRLLVRSSEHYLHGTVLASMLFGEKKSTVSVDNVDDIMKEVGHVMGVSGFRLVHAPSLAKDLLHMDETFVKAHHKVGVLQVKEGQRNEEDIFCNRHEAGAPFDEFLNVLGGRVPLHGFKGFLGGLDNERDLTGELSVYTKFEELEIMFHVSTLLPFSPKDTQQVNKKRHIGNDIVCVVFLDSARTTFNPSWIRSHFIHCYVVIQHTPGKNGHPLYKVGVAHRNNVPSFQPSLRERCVFEHSHTFQQLLLTKIVNGERASYHAPRFLKLTNRSRGQLLMEITSSFCEESIKQGKNPRKILKRSNWLPIGASRPPSPPLDPVHEKYTNTDKLAEDFSIALRGCELADVMFIVGADRIPLYGVKAILACRSRVFRTMFKEFKPSSAISRLSSPLLRRRVPTVSHQYMSPPNTRKSRILGIGRLKKKMSVPDNLASKVESAPDSTSSGLGATSSFADDPRNTQIKEQYVVEDFSEAVFMELLNYTMLGACSIKPSNVVGLACAAEHYEIMALREACHQQLPKCLSVNSVCEILGQLEKHLAFAAAKTMIVQSLEFVDNNAHELLESERFLGLSENMVHLVLRRDTNVPEILKVKAAFSWGKVNVKPQGPDFKTLVTPLVKHVRLHLISPKDLVEILAPSEIFDIDKVMAALAYQVDPESVEPEDYTMFRPRKKSNVLSSH